MKKLLPMGALALAILAGLAISLQPAQQAAAIGQCSRTFSTAQVTGVSSVDCLWAKMDAQMQAEALVGCNDTCFEDLVVIDDNNCQKFFPANEFRVVARIDYQCNFGGPD